MGTTAVLSFPEHPAVLVASSQTELRREIVNTLAGANWRAQEARGGADALSQLEEGGCQILLLDSALHDLDANEVSVLAQTRFPGLQVVVVDASTGRPSRESEASGGVAELMQLLFGAVECDDLPPAIGPQNTLGTPVKPRTHSWLPPSSEAGTASGLGKACSLGEVERLPGMVGNSPQMRHVSYMVRLVAPRTTPVMITGSTGSGKELVARAIHALSPRAQKPLVTINCAAIPESLLESELFGYVRGAFTGAVQSRIGRIHAAHGGTLFLDEIGEMPLNLQPKLLRFLEDGEVQRLGSSDVFRVDVRLVAATNMDLERSMRAGTFRKDLFYRLSAFPVALPPLAQRTGDVVALAEHFLTELCPSPVGLSAAAIERLRQHHWPGNVRELRHVMERASILAQGSTVIGPEHIMLSSQDQVAVA